MADNFFDDKASMLTKGISSLSRAIGEEAKDIVSTVGNTAKNPLDTVDLISTGIGALDLTGALNLNPLFAAGKGIYDISRLPAKYDQQKIDDLAKYGNEASSFGTFARTLPLVGGIASFFSGPPTRPDLDPKFRAYLAQRGVNPNDYEGPPIYGPKPQAPVSGPFGLPAFKGLIASPWVNPNFPNPNPMIDLNAIQQRAEQAERAAQIAKAEQSAQATIDRSIQGDMIDSGDYTDDQYGAMFDGIDDYSVG